MKQKSSRNIKAIIAGSLILLVMVFIIALDSRVGEIEPAFEEVSTFMSSLQDGKVYAVFRQSEDMIWYIHTEDLKEDFDKTEKPKNVLSILKMVEDDKWHSANLIITEKMYDELCAGGVHYYTSISFEPISKTALLAATSVLTVLIPILLLFMLYEKLVVGDMNVDIYQVTKDTGKTFDDVVGHDEIIEDIREYVNILKNSSSIAAKGIRQPKGLLLSGPPGTGKTLIAKALAGESGLPFIYADSSAMIDRFVGVGALNIRKYFKRARENAPCILFLDELDAIGCKRHHSGSNSEHNQTLLALLQALDGFATANGVLVIGATNNPDALDPALKRPGRFDREIKIMPPQNRGVRIKLLELYTKNLKLAEDVSLKSLAGQMQGLTGADIAFICNEAAIMAVMRDKDNVILTTDDFILALDKMLLKGNRKKTSETDRDRLVAAYHEAGHAVTAYLTGNSIGRVTIQSSTSGVGGYVLQEDKANTLQTKAQLIEQIKICYGGRCSEAIEFGEEAVTIGAYNDIQQATTYIMSLVTSFGYDDTAGLLDYRQLLDSKLINDDLLNKRVRELAIQYHEETLKLLRDNYALVESLAERLCDVEEMSGDAVCALFNSMQTQRR